MNTKEILKNEQKSNGITLISLVITIIILLILAGISISVLLGHDGLINKTNSAKENYEISQIQEKLELIKAPVKLEGNKITLDSYLEKLNNTKQLGFEIDPVQRVDDLNAYVIADSKYQFLIKDEKNGNVIIIYQGKVGQLKPTIKNVEVTNTTNSITAKVEATRAESYKYYIKDSLEGQYELKGENKTGEYTYKDLTQNVTYYIKVEAINSTGTVDREITRATSEMVSITEGELETEILPIGWTNENKVTKAIINTEENISNYKLQFSKTTNKDITTEEFKKLSWTNYTETGIISEQNEIIYFRLFDGNNATSYMTREVTNIDKTEAEITTALNSSDVKTNGFKLNVGVTDEESGLGKIIWYYKLSTASEYTNVEEEYTKLNGEEAGTTTAITKSLTVNNLTSGTYKAYAEIYDVAGNKTTATEITINTGSVSAATEATYTPTTWTNGKVTVTLPTMSGFTTRYTTNGSAPTKTSTEYKEPFTVSSNCTVNYIYTDGTNIGGAAAANITNIDTVDPTINTALNATSVKTNGFTLNIAATDTTSGFSKVIWYYKLSGASKYTAITEEDTAMSGDKAGTKTKVTKTKTLSGLISGTYKAYAEIYDVAGNKATAAEITINTGSISAASGATYEPTTWTNGNVTVTLPTKTGYTTRYTTNGAAPTKTSTAYTGPFTVSSNCTINYIFTDGTNIGAAGSEEITNIDKADPTSVSLSAGTVNNKKIVLTAKATDNLSGIKNYKIYVDGGLKKTITTTDTSTTYTWTSTFGDHTAYVVATDNANNTTTSSTISFSDYTINTAAEWQTFASSIINDNNTYSGKTVKLINDITIDEYISIGTKKSDSFQGTFDGGYKTITLNIATNSEFCGLFGYLYNATIKNVIIGEKSDIQNGGSYTGAIAGFVRTSTISNCANKGTCIGENGCAGGIVGYNADGTIENCFNTGSIYSGSENEEVGHVGGIAGYSAGTITNCYNRGECGTQYNSGVGGIVGRNAGTITNCYNTGIVTVQVEDLGGGIVGWNDGTVSKCYFLDTATAKGCANLVSGTCTTTSKTAAQLKALASTLGSAFKTDSSTINAGYPILSWQ